MAACSTTERTQSPGEHQVPTTARTQSAGGCFMTVIDKTALSLKSTVTLVFHSSLLSKLEFFIPDCESLFTPKRSIPSFLHKIRSLYRDLSFPLHKHTFERTDDIRQTFCVNLSDSPRRHPYTIINGFLQMKGIQFYKL